jgi:hypothetical protein
MPASSKAVKQSTLLPLPSPVPQHISDFKQIESLYLVIFICHFPPHRQELKSP